MLARVAKEAQIAMGIRERSLQEIRRSPVLGYVLQFLHLEMFRGTLGAIEAAEILGRLLEVAYPKIYVGEMGIKESLREGRCGF